MRLKVCFIFSPAQHSSCTAFFRMEPTLRSLTLLLLLAISNAAIQAPSNCPWDDPELEKWSDHTTWPTGQIPQEDTEVFIPKGKKVVLDTQIPRLLHVTINGTLVWGNVDGIRMETSFLLVNGEFHIGSEECNFEKTADIFLYGKSNSVEVVPVFGRKFIGAASGSTLEIHGKQKKSWTKLVATLSPVRPGRCGLIYDSSVS
ncbi:hypothetical protein RRG08_043868 [Elysia crispata]|uniref:G8 domain-containing protein n=1 Tax=Elysia crispata TaxID=231223 RepID=A0AAE0XUZ6_9GAST|nr:hypothetical protein RRG08_043868 [Elysia crispata]